MKTIVITKGTNADAFVPADARASIKIDKIQPDLDAAGDATDDLFTVMYMDGIDPFIPLRNFHLGEVMTLEVIVGWAKLTSVMVEVMDGDVKETIFDPATYEPVEYAMTLNAKIDIAPAEDEVIEFAVQPTDIQGLPKGDAVTVEVTIPAGKKTGTADTPVTDDSLYDVKVGTTVVATGIQLFSDVIVNYNVPA